MNQVEVESNEIETSSVVISPMKLTVSYAIVMISLLLQMFFALSLFIDIAYFYIFIAQIVLFFFATVVIIVISNKMEKTENIREKQNIKLVASSFVLLLSVLFFVAALMMMLYGFSFNYSIGHLEYIIVNWKFQFYMIFLFLQGTFQLIGHELFNSTMKEIFGKTKTTLGIRISIFGFGGLLLLQVIALILTLNSNLLLVALYLFYISYTAIIVISGVAYGFEIKITRQILAQT